MLFKIAIETFSNKFTEEITSVESLVNRVNMYRQQEDTMLVHLIDFFGKLNLKETETVLKLDFDYNRIEDDLKAIESYNESDDLPY